MIEALVFQERTIVAGDVGNTYTFTADFKRGNIEGASTALAFIKTLDPNAGFQTIDFITVDTTNASDTWSTLSVQITIEASDVGLLLQYGFQNTSSNNEGSGIFYDNVSFCAGDNGGGGPGGGELTTNGDFETGDFTGWTNFCDNGAASCTITTDNPNGGTFAARLEQPTPGQNVVIKQERIAAGEVATGDTIAVTFFLRGAVGVGGVVFLELFTEETGGNVIQEGIVGFTPTNDWVEISETFTITGNPGDGITVQIAGVTGADAGSFVDAYVDDVSAVVDTP